MNSNLFYRRGVGVMLLNAEHKVFAGLRCDSLTEAWQMPQGGIDENEAPLDAVFRELEEEVGTNDVTFVTEYPGLLKYDLPDEVAMLSFNGKFKGQEQNWYLMKLNLNAQINIQTEHPEFRQYKWVDVEELPNLIVPFKREMYQKIVSCFAPIIAKLKV